MKFKIVLFNIILFLSCNSEESIELNLLDYVPQNTIATFQINDSKMAENAIENIPFLKALLKFKNDLYDDISLILLNDKNYNGILNITVEGKDNYGVTFISKNVIKDSLQYLYSDKLEYSGVQIFIENFGSKKIYKTELNKIQIKSSSQLITENIIRNVKNKKKGIQDEQFFRLANVRNKNAPLTVYFHNDIKTIMNNLFPKTDLFPYLGRNWFSFDFNTKKDPFTLDGVSIINDSIPDKLDLFKELKPQPIIGTEIIPQNFEEFLSIPISDYKDLENNFSKYSRFSNTALSKINFDPLSVIGEISFLKNKTKNAIYFHLNNSEIVPSELLSDNENKSSFRSVEIKSQQLPDDIMAFLNSFGIKFSPGYVAKVDEFLIYSDKSYLKQLISAYKDGNTLNKDNNFKTLKSDLADNSSFLWIGNTINLKDMWSSANNAKKRDWNKVQLKSFPLVVLQGVSENQFVQSRFTLQKDNPNIKKNTVINQYSFSLDAPIAKPPQWIKNHRNKTMDIVIQDQNNVLYLFSNKGVLYWKKQLSGPIIGKIEQVDLYKNRRLQMAFRTSDRFLILDRNGNIVKPFNKKIDSDEPNYLSVFDYDLNRNYRFLLVNGKKIQMFDRRGKIVSGFKLKKLKHPLKNKAKHIRFGNKDFIVLQDLNGQVRIINRQGDDRIILKEIVNTSSNPIFEYRKTFAGTSKNGNFIQIDTKGNVNKSSLGLKPGHKIDMTSKSLVTLSENKLIIKGIPVILPFGNYTPPKIHYLKNTIYITLTDLDTQNVYAFYSNGKTLEGFPVFGNSNADITNADNDPALEMLVQSENNGVIVYQLN